MSYADTNRPSRWTKPVVKALSAIQASEAAPNPDPSETPSFGPAS